MARYRRIDTRINSDEKLRDADPLYQLLWFKMLTHSLLTPVGAGSFPIGLLDQFLGNDDGWCYRCAGRCEEDGDSHTARGAIKWFAEQGMILRDGDLIIFKNFLLYNRPENRNQLAGWIECCEELPRSSAWGMLHDHLSAQDPAIPDWLMRGLIEPLAAGHIRGLRDKFEQRISATENHPPNPPPMVTGMATTNPNPNPPPTQEQEQEQEQEEKKQVRPRFDFESLYRDYPKHEGKAKGMALCKAKIRTPEDYERLKRAVRNYAAKVQREGTEVRYRLLWQTFMSGRWEDFVDAEPNGNARASPAERKYLAPYHKPIDLDALFGPRPEEPSGSSDADSAEPAKQRGG